MFSNILDYNRRENEKERNKIEEKIKILLGVREGMREIAGENNKIVLRV